MSETRTKTGRALSIQQPWAWLIVSGHKDVENRTWATNVRGWVGIHAGQKLDREGWEWVRREFPAIPLPHPDTFEREACARECERIGEQLKPESARTAQFLARRVRARAEPRHPARKSFKDMLVEGYNEHRQGCSCRRCSGKWPTT